MKRVGCNKSSPGRISERIRYGVRPGNSLITGRSSGPLSTA